MCSFETSPCITRASVSLPDLPEVVLDEAPSLGGLKEGVYPAVSPPIQYFSICLKWKVHMYLALFISLVPSSPPLSLRGTFTGQR